MQKSYFAKIMKKIWVFAHFVIPAIPLFRAIQLFRAPSINFENHLQKMNESKHESPWWRVWLAPWRQSLRTPIIIIGLVKRFDQIYFCIELLYFFLKFFNFINLFLLYIKPSIYLQIYLTAGSSNSIILFASKGFHAFR